WRTSGENLFVVLLMMAPPSQELEPPANPGRFILTMRREDSEVLRHDCIVRADVLVRVDACERLSQRDRLWILHIGLPTAKEYQRARGANVNRTRIDPIDQIGYVTPGYHLPLEVWNNVGFYRAERPLVAVRHHVVPHRIKPSNQLRSDE